MTDFFINHSAEILTLASATVGAFIALIGQFIVQKMNNHENLRKERATVVKELYSLHTDLYVDMKNINSTIQYLDASKKELAVHFKKAELSMNKFSNYYMNNSIVLPKKSAESCNPFHTAAIQLMIGAERSIGYMLPDETTHPEKESSFKIRKAEWNKSFSVVEEQKVKFSDSLRDVYEGKIKLYVN